MDDIDSRLSDLREQGLYRHLREVSGSQGPTITLDGRTVLSMCSNNYLGLADDPRVRTAAADAALRFGAGAGASRLVSGAMTIHRTLEERLAAFEGTESCLLFGSGYLANLGVIGALAGPGDVVFSDRLNHASIIDGCRLSRAQVVVYRHLDIDHLAWCLRRHPPTAGERGRRTIVTDSVFSMDGDIAPLVEISELARSHGARVVVDEAHAKGAVGPGGRGAVAEAGLEREIDVIVGTLGKALGSYGAYACGDASTVDYLINVARPVIFSTAPPPPSVAAALSALKILQEEPERVDRLRRGALLLRSILAEDGLAVQLSEMQIVPLIVGAAEDAVALCEALLDDGIFAQAIRPPTVAPGTSRLRLTVMATHSEAELVGAGRKIAAAVRALGLDMAGPPGRVQRDRRGADGDGDGQPG